MGSLEIIPAPVAVPESQLIDLKRRLEHTRWPDRETVPDWSQGVPLAYLQQLCSYWREHYDWRRWEQQLNRFSPSRAIIDGVGIHFLHVRSPHPHALPLIMTHGWPGSVAEFRKVIGPLTDPPAFAGRPSDAFHLVCPTLPGYGFSDKPTARGWGVEQIARAWDQLMSGLGYRRYVAQGGDWGSVVTHCLALTAAECIGMHTHMPIAIPPEASRGHDLEPIEREALEVLRQYREADAGYAQQQSTRPQTLGYALADSPSGQLAWIVEKFWSWMDCGEGDARHPENVLSKDELLDNVMMYWLSNSAASSARLYWESFRSWDRTPITKPVGVSLFRRELFTTSRRWAQMRYPNLIHFNALDRGGHFAALEQPALFVDELRSCFRTLR